MRGKKIVKHTDLSYRDYIVPLPGKRKRKGQVIEIWLYCCYIGVITPILDKNTDNEQEAGFVGS